MTGRERIAELEKRVSELERAVRSFQTMFPGDAATRPAEPLPEFKIIVAEAKAEP